MSTIPTLETRNIFQVAMKIVTNGDKTLDKLAKPMAAQLT